MTKFLLSIVGILFLLILSALAALLFFVSTGEPVSDYGPNGSLYVSSSPKETNYIKIREDENPEDNIYTGSVYSSLYNGSPYEEVIYQGKFTLEDRKPENFNPRNHADIAGWYDGRISLKDGGYLQVIDSEGFVSARSTAEGPDASSLVEQVSKNFFFKVEHGDSVEDDLYMVTFYKADEETISHTGNFTLIKNSSSDIIYPVQDYSYFSWEGDALLLRDGSYLESVDPLPEWVK